MGSCCSSDDSKNNNKNRRDNNRNAHSTLRPKNHLLSNFDDDTNSHSGSSSHVAPRTWRWERHGDVILNKNGEAVSPNYEDQETTTADPSDNNNIKESNRQNRKARQHPTFIEPQLNTDKYPTGSLPNTIEAPGGLLDGEYFSLLISPALAAAITNAVRIVNEAETIAASSDHHTGLLEFEFTQELENCEAQRKSDFNLDASATTVEGRQVQLVWPWNENEEEQELLRKRGKCRSAKNQHEQSHHQTTSGEDDDESEPEEHSQNVSASQIKKIKKIENNVSSCYSVFLGGSNRKKFDTSEGIGWSAYELCITADVDYTMKERKNYQNIGPSSSTTAHRDKNSNTSIRKSSSTADVTESIKKPLFDLSRPHGIKTKKQQELENPIPARCVAGLGIAMRISTEDPVSTTSESSDSAYNRVFQNKFASSTNNNSFHHGVGGGAHTSAIGSLYSLPPIKPSSSFNRTSSFNEDFGLSASAIRNKAPGNLEQAIKIKIVESYSVGNEINNRNNNNARGKKENNNTNYNGSQITQVIAKVVLLVNQGRLCISTDDAERQEEALKRKRQDFFGQLASPGIRTPRGSKLPDFENEHEILESDNEEEENIIDENGSNTNQNSEKETKSPTFDPEKDDPKFLEKKKQQEQQQQATTGFYTMNRRRKSFNNTSVEGRYVGLESAHISQSSPAAQWFLHVAGLSHPYAEIHDADTTVLFESVAHPGFFLTVDCPNVDLRRFALPSMLNPVQWNLSLTIRERNIPEEIVEKEFLEDFLLTSAAKTSSVLAQDYQKHHQHQRHHSGIGDGSGTGGGGLLSEMRNRISHLEMTEVEKYIQMVSAFEAAETCTPLTTTATTSTQQQQHEQSSKNDTINKHPSFRAVSKSISALAVPSSLSSSALEYKTLPVPFPPCPLLARDMTQSFRLVHVAVKPSSGSNSNNSNSAVPIDLPTGRESHNGLAPWTLPWYGANAVCVGVMDFSVAGPSAVSHSVFAALNRNYSSCENPNDTFHGLRFETSLSSSTNTPFYIIPDALYHVKIVCAEDPSLVLAATGGFLKLKTFVTIKKKSTTEKSKSPPLHKNPLSNPPQQQEQQPQQHSPPLLPRTKNNIFDKNNNNNHHNKKENDDKNENNSNDDGTTIDVLSSKKLEVAFCTVSALRKKFKISNYYSGSSSSFRKKDKKSENGTKKKDSNESSDDEDYDDDEDDQHHHLLLQQADPSALLAEDASLWRPSFIEGACPVRREAMQQQHGQSYQHHLSQHHQVERFNVGPVNETEKTTTTVTPTPKETPQNGGNHNEDLDAQNNNNKKIIRRRSSTAMGSATTAQNIQLEQTAKQLCFVNKLFPGYCLTFSKNLSQWCLAVVGGEEEEELVFDTKTNEWKNLTLDASDDDDDDSEIDIDEGDLRDVDDVDNNNNHNNNNNNNHFSRDDVKECKRKERNDTLLQGILVEPFCSCLSTVFENNNASQSNVFDNNNTNNEKEGKNLSSQCSLAVLSSKLSSLPTQLLTRFNSPERRFVQKWFNALFNYFSTNNSHYLYMKDLVDKLKKQQHHKGKSPKQQLLLETLQHIQTTNNNFINCHNNSLQINLPGKSRKKKKEQQQQQQQQEQKQQENAKEEEETVVASPGSSTTTASNASPMSNETAAVNNNNNNDRNNNKPVTDNQEGALLFASAIPLPFDALSLGIVPLMSKIGSAASLVRVVVYHEVENVEQNNNNIAENNSNIEEQQQQNELSIKDQEANNNHNSNNNLNNVQEIIVKEQQSPQQQQQKQSDLVLQLNDTETASSNGNNNKIPSLLTTDENNKEKKPPVPPLINFISTTNTNTTTTTTTTTTHHQRTHSRRDSSNNNYNNVATAHNNTSSRPQSSLSITSELTHGQSLKRDDDPNAFSSHNSTMAAVAGSSNNNSNNNNNNATLNRITGLANSQAGWILQWTRQEEQQLQQQQTRTKSIHSSDDNNNQQPQDNFEEFFERTRQATIVTEQLNNSFLLIPVLDDHSNINHKNAGGSKFSFLLLHLASCTASPVRKPMFLTYVTPLRNNNTSDNNNNNNNNNNKMGSLTLASLNGSRRHQVFSIDV